jgi:hypothetical protein
VVGPLLLTFVSRETPRCLLFLLSSP